MTKRSKQEIALGRRPARVGRIGQLAVAAEVPENPLDYGLLLDAGDHPELPATTSASLYVDGEHPYMDAPTLPSFLFMTAGRIRLHPYIRTFAAA
jgi:hypothetical protein